MKKLLVCAALAAVASAPVTAQEPVTKGRGSFFLGPYAGYMVFGDLFESTDGDVETSFQNGAFYGAQAGYSFTPNVTLLGNFGYTKSKMTLETDPEGFTGSSQPISDDLGIFFYDANLQLRLPLANRLGDWVAPLAQAGVGAVKYTFDTDDFQSRGRTDVAYNVGVGADFQLGRAVGLRLMAKDYITSFRWDRPRNANDPNDALDGIKGNVAHNWALTAGLNIGF